MQRIAFISEHASPLAPLGGADGGGQNVYVGNLARELGRLGYLVDIYTRRDEPGAPQIVDWCAGVRVIRIDAGPARVLPKEALLTFMPQFSQAIQRFMRTAALRYALAHAHFFMSGMVAKELKRRLGLPYVITFHALGRVRRLYQGDADGFPDTRFAIEEALMRDADCVIAECEQDRCDMLALYGAPAARLAVVPCGFDPDEFWPVRATARATLGLPERDFIVLQLGRMVPRKGVDNVLRGLRHLLDEQRIVARLLVVGGEGGADPMATPEIWRLAQLARALGIDDQVSFTGAQPRQRLREYYSAANVFVTTPWYEPFGITPLEAMACATPVVGSAVGGILSTVLDRQTGFLVPPNNPEALAAPLAQLQRDPALAQRMGWTGLRRAHRHFTWGRVAMQVASVYRSVLSRSVERFYPSPGNNGLAGSATLASATVSGVAH
jgi:glycosyltransferase involved in cell wall biosynthesis